MTLIVFNVSVSVKIAEYPYSSKHYTLPSNTLSREMFQYLYMKIQQDFQLEPENYYITLRDLIGQAPCVVVENTSIRNQFHLKHRFNRIGHFHTDTITGNECNGMHSTVQGSRVGRLH